MPENRRPIPSVHPRLFGTREELIERKARLPEAYRRMAAVADSSQDNEWAAAFSLSLACAIEGGEERARRAHALAMKIVRERFMEGHEPFAHEFAKVAAIWDACHERFTQEDRKVLFDWVAREYEANIPHENHRFFNGYYGYKMFGLGLMGYALWPDFPRAREILDYVEGDMRERAMPCVRFAGEGGGWPEGYYIHYFMYEWLLYCEAALRLEGLDWYAQAPEFFRRRHVAMMFECYPGVGERGTRCMPCWGDGGGRDCHPERDKSLAARRILTRRFAGEDASPFCEAFNRETPRMGFEFNAYRDFLFDNSDLPAKPLDGMPLACVARGAGHVYARSSWKDDATYLAFKCSRRFAGHQHLDAGHFEIFKHEVLAADSGQYSNFHDSHAIHYYLRTIAHNTMLVHDPEETWKCTRSRLDGDNDGGQAYLWGGTAMGPNGGAADLDVWRANREIAEIADIAAFEDRPEWMYAAGDCTRAYSPRKLKAFTRQIVFLRPDTVVVFDRVASTRPEFRKTWLLHTVREPSAPGGERPIEPGRIGLDGDRAVATHGRGRLFVQFLLPEDRRVEKIGGRGVKDYWYGGKHYPVGRDYEADRAPRWRIEVSPAAPRCDDVFLHVLTAASSAAGSAPRAELIRRGDLAGAKLGGAEVLFRETGPLGGGIALPGRGDFRF